MKTDQSCDLVGDHVPLWRRLLPTAGRLIDVAVVYPKRVGVMLSLASLLVLWSFVIEPSSLSIHRQSIRVSKWATPSRPFVVALLGDLHVGSPYYGLDKLKVVVNTTNDLSPDLILLAGDFVIHGIIGGSFVPPEEFGPVLRELRAKHGVFAVLGNHDWWFDGARVERALVSAGIPVLEDRAVPIPSEVIPNLWLAGISDEWEGAHNIGKALRDIPPNAQIIAFTHNPDTFAYMNDRVGLTLAAHTHGGQVYLPVVGSLVVPSRYGNRYARGLVEEKGKQLFVTTGLGTSMLPVRFRVPPEIALLSLQ